MEVNVMNNCESLIGNKVAQLGERDLHIAQLIYNAWLYCYVVIELKLSAGLKTISEPEHAGKLNVYIKAIDEQLCKQGDARTIGILLCKTRDKVVAEYVLSDINKPMGISEYKLTQSLPEALQNSLPSVAELALLGGDHE